MTTYQNPTPTVDVIIELADRPGTVVLIERKHTPIGWALPGGFVDRGEWVADAGVREAKEETGLDAELTEKQSCTSTSDTCSRGLVMPASL